MLSTKCEFLAGATFPKGKSHPIIYWQDNFNGAMLTFDVQHDPVAHGFALGVERPALVRPARAARYPLDDQTLARADNFR